MICTQRERGVIPARVGAPRLSACSAQLSELYLAPMPLPEKQLPLSPPPTPVSPWARVCQAPTRPSLPLPPRWFPPQGKEAARRALQRPGRQGHVGFEARLPIGHVGLGLAAPVAGAAVGPGTLGLGQELEGEERARVVAPAAAGGLGQAQEGAGRLPLGEGAQLDGRLGAAAQVAGARRGRGQGPLAAAQAAAAIIQRVLARL